MSQYTHIVEVPEDTEIEFLFQKVLLAEMAFLSLSLSLPTHTHTHSFKGYDRSLRSALACVFHILREEHYLYLYLGTLNSL